MDRLPSTNTPLPPKPATNDKQQTPKQNTHLQSDFIMDKETGKGASLDPTGEIAQRIREEIQAEQVEELIHPHTTANPHHPRLEPRFGMPTAGRIHRIADISNPEGNAQDGTQTSKQAL
ncbi:hypothetical protein FS842_004167 [Serendipita sp. 407]|nr:hypothetical protein FS842_004167 [Serendipita sp. 407]